MCSSPVPNVVKDSDRKVPVQTWLCSTPDTFNYLEFISSGRREAGARFKHQIYEIFPADVQPVEVSAEPGKKKSFFKRRNWPWRRFNSSPLPLKKKSGSCQTLCDLYESLTMRQTVIFVNTRRREEWLLVSDSLSWQSLFCWSSAEWCQDQWRSSVCSVQDFILFLLTSCLILKSGVILVFLSSFPPVWFGCLSLMCSTCVSSPPLPHVSRPFFARLSRCYTLVVQWFYFFLEFFPS